MGHRYRLHKRELPGNPDLVFVSRNKVLFINGCFWHGHENCKLARPPKSNIEYWLPKLERNKARDIATNDKLVKLGWYVLTIWECELKQIAKVKEKISNFLET